MRVRHDDDFELLVLAPLVLVVGDVPALLPDAAVRVVERQLVVDVGHPDVTLVGKKQLRLKARIQSSTERKEGSFFLVSRQDMANQKSQ